MITRRYEQLGIRNRCYYWSLVVCFGVALFFAHRTLACSIAYEANITFDPEEFVFEGVVLGFVADSSLYAGGYANYYLDSDEDFEPAGGLIVRPTDSINIPIQADSFLVFPAGLGADCESVYAPPSGLRENYSVGDRVAIVAYQMGKKKQRIRKANSLKLKASWRGLLVNISRNDTGRRHGVDIKYEPWPGLLQELGSADWGELDNLLEELERGVNRERSWLIARRAEYEYRRDLAALHHSRSTLEKIAILHKIYLYRVTNFQNSYLRRLNQCEYGLLVDKYLPSQRAQARLSAVLINNNRSPVATRRICKQMEWVWKRIQEEKD